MVGTLSLFLHVLLVFLFISATNSTQKSVELIETCQTDKKISISGWSWEIRNNTEVYYINICGRAKGCGEGISVCKKDKSGKILNYGSSVASTKKLPTLSYGKGFSITFNGSSESKCSSKKIQTKINFQCDKTLGSPELVDDNGCKIIIEFFTKEACSKPDTSIAEIPCSIYNPVDNKKRDLSPLIKLSGGHRVSIDKHNVEIFINVCRDIKFNAKVPANACKDDSKASSSAACRVDKKIGIGRITKHTRLHYDGDKIKLIYNTTTTTDCKLFTTEITFVCQEHFSSGGTGPVLVTDISSSSTPCKYEIIWRTGHACVNNDVITKECQFSNGEVSFDLTKLEKAKKRYSYRVPGGGYEYRIKVCSNGQSCGSDVNGAHTAVCQMNPKSGSSSTDRSCGNADDRSIRYADGVLTLVYKNGALCSNNIHRRTIITFRCDASIEVGEPTFVDEEHCYYYFEWKTRHVCPSRKAGACSVISDKGQAYDLSILTKVNATWLVLNDRKNAAGSTYRINVCGNVASLGYEECRESAACELNGEKIRGLGRYTASSPTVTAPGRLRLKYTGGKCEYDVTRNVTTVIKFICQPKDLESPPELESKSLNGCEFVFTWSTAAACGLQVVSGEGCVLEDSKVTGNVFDLSPLVKGPADYFTVKNSDQTTFLIKMCSKDGLASNLCGSKGSSIGVCQKTKDGTFIAGKIHDNLYYYDGVLKLKFTDGEKCTQKKNPPRKSYITFFCDETADPGKPTFVKETYCVYHFVWYTKYACPLKTLECVVKDSKGREYDLSPLVKPEDNWKVVKDGKTYYINVCRVLHRSNETSACPASSSACMKNSSGTYTIGKINRPMSMNPRNHPSLQYDADKCRTLIVFICDEQGLTGSPELTSLSDESCVYTFTWITKEACPIKPRQENGCNDKDSGLGALKSSDGKGYEIDGPSDGSKIVFDICRNVTCQNKKNSAACLKPNKGAEMSIGRSAFSTIEHSQDQITLTYPGGGLISTDDWARYAETKINFFCSKLATANKPVFREKRENVFYIDFATPVVCGGQAVSCTARSKDGKTLFNLEPLSLTNGNWMAQDTRAHLDYYINVCHEYYQGGAEYVCKGTGGIGGCQVDIKNKKAHNMGYKSSPVVSSSGQVTLRYTGGEGCHHAKYKRSTRINLFCSDIHGSPVFMMETQNCEYVFNWKTPSACPLESYDGNCTIFDEKYGTYYALSKLETLISKDIGGGIVYKMGFCGTTPKGCGDGYHSCLVKGDTAISNFKVKLKGTIYYDGKITATHGNSTFSIVNEIDCGETSFETISKSSDSYHISWKSDLVCPLVKGEECSLTHDRHLYDLSVLAKEKWNWLARNDVGNFNFKDYEFEFSVCKPLKEVTGLKDKGSRGVMRDNSTGRVTSLGTMISRLHMKNGYLTMTYGFGDDIPSRCKNAITTIQFVCDDVIPEGVGVLPVVDGFDENSCEFHVTWQTRAACPVRSQNGNSDAACTAVHPATRKSIDLKQLNSKNGYTVYDELNNKYVLNVCGSPKTKGCPKNSGICKAQEDGKYKSVGSVNTTLVYRQGFLYLYYKNGSICEQDKARRTETLISFVCDYSAELGKPTLERTDGCTHFVTWKTSLACEAEVDCVARGSEVYDLSPLIKNVNNYELLHEGRVYLINVCRSLVNGSKCPSNAAVCALPYNGQPAADLGHVTSSPKFVSQKDGKSEVKVQLIYENGNCSKGGKKSGRTTINFICDRHEHVGRPVIVNASECSASITWWTSLVCANEPITSDNCTFHDPDQEFCFDLKKLSKKKPQFIQVPGGKAHIHVCGSPARDCTEGAEESKSGEACLMLDGKFPKAYQRKNIIYDGQEVRILYDEELVLLLYCGKEDKSDRPQYIGKYKNQYFFNLITPEVCPPHQLACEIERDGAVYNLAGLRDRGSHLVKASDGSRYWVSICGHIHYTAETKICSSRVTAIRFPTQDAGQPEVIGMDMDHQLTYQDGEDYPLRLQYSGNEIHSRCSGGKKAKVVHKFKCRKIMSPPRLENFDPDNCVYTFLWQTFEACAEKRTPLKQIGSDWIFYDEKRPGCNLDLTVLKQNISRLYAKDCELSAQAKVYSHGEEYELYTDCSKPSHKKTTIDVIMICADDTKWDLLANRNSHLSVLWKTIRVCDTERITSCRSKGLPGSAGKAAAAVIGSFAAIGLLAAILFFACKPEKRTTAALWLRWHVRKYICCKPSYQASYRYKKVNTGDGEDGETDFIIESGAGSLFSDSEDDDYNHNSDEKDDDDDDLLPLDDDLLNLE